MPWLSCSGTRIKGYLSEGKSLLREEQGRARKRPGLTQEKLKRAW